MKLAIVVYLAAGILLLLAGFYGTGDCPIKNKDVVSDGFFVIVWPVYFAMDVLAGPYSATGWLHLQTCQGGIPLLR